MEIKNVDRVINGFVLDKLRKSPWGYESYNLWNCFNENRHKIKTVISLGIRESLYEIST